MAKIALGIHLESSVHEMQYSIRCINDRLTAQQSLLNELQQFSQSTTTKAELHAAMACLTYKNMGLALPSNSLHDIIKDKFANSEHIRPSEVKGYLANPFEALASMAEKIKRMEILRKEEMDKKEEESLRQKEEIALLKRAIADQDLRMNQFFSAIGASNIAIQTLSQQQRHMEKSSMISKPPLLNSGNEEQPQKDRSVFLDQPLDMATYWNIPEEEGLDDLEGDEEEDETVEETDHTSLRKNSEAQLATPLPHIPPPDENTPTDLLTPSGASLSSPKSDTLESSATGTPSDQVNGFAAAKRRESSLPSAVMPTEPSSSSHRPSQRPSFMSVRRKISAVTAISQPGEPLLPPTKARTSLVRTISKTEAIPAGAMGNYVTLSQFQEFRQQREAAENGFKTRLKSVENVTAQVMTLHEALKILSEEIRVTSEELTGNTKKEIAELKDGQLQSFQEVFKVIESCYQQIKILQTAAQSKPKAAGNSFAMETVHQEMRILQQNVESLRTQMVIQATKQPQPPSSTTALAQSDPSASPLLPPPPAIPQAEVVKIATEISKLDTSVGVLYQRCSSLQEEFLLHQETLQRSSHPGERLDLEQLEIGHPLRSSTLYDPTLAFQPSATAPPLTPSQHHSSSLASASAATGGPGERTNQRSVLQEFHESKLQELQSISAEIKQLQEEIESVKTASSEIFERYHVHLPQAMADGVSLRAAPPQRQPLSDSLSDFPQSQGRGLGLEQYAMHDHRFQSLQREMTELREKVEQIYYLSLSAVSMAQQHQQQQHQQQADGSNRQTQERKPSPGLSFQQLHFSEKSAKKESNSALPPRPSVSASSSRRKPGSAAAAVAGQQRPNSSIGISRGDRHSSSDDLLTPPTVSFVDTIEPPLRPPPRHSLGTGPVTRSPSRPKAKTQPVSSKTLERSPLHQQLLLLAGGGSLSFDENSMNSGVLVPPFDDLRIGESNSSVWERDESLDPPGRGHGQGGGNSSEAEDMLNRLPTALLYGSITVRDAAKYDKEHQQDDTWYRTFQLPGKSNSGAVNVKTQAATGGVGGGGYVGSLTEYTGDWKMPLLVQTDQT